MATIGTVWFYSYPTRKNLLSLIIGEETLPLAEFLEDPQHELRWVHQRNIFPLEIITASAINSTLSPTTLTWSSPPLAEA